VVMHAINRVKSLSRSPRLTLEYSSIPDGTGINFEPILRETLPAVTRNLRAVQSSSELTAEASQHWFGRTARISIPRLCTIGHVTFRNDGPCPGVGAFRQSESEVSLIICCPSCSGG